jgi:hypothetical protein
MGISAGDSEREGIGGRWTEACPARRQEIRTGDRLVGVDVRSSQSNHPLPISSDPHPFYALSLNQKRREANNQSRITFPPHPVSVRTTVSSFSAIH